MEVMQILGWIAISFFALVGFAIAVLAIAEYFAIQWNLFGSKVKNELEVRKEHIAAQGEAKKTRLARKREVNGRIKDKKLEIQLERTKSKAREKFGEDIFEASAEAAEKPSAQPKKKEQENVAKPEE